MGLDILFLPKLLPRADIIGGPILIYHRVKNLSSMGHNITLIAPAYTEKDRNDESLAPFCERIILIDSTKKRSQDELEALHRKLDRPKFFLGGDGGFSQEFEDAFKLLLEERHFDAIITEYSMMGQYLEANRSLIPADTMSVISVHECYTIAFELRAEKGEDINKDIISELSDYEFKMYEAVDKLLTLTGEDADALVNHAPNLGGKISVVPHGVDTTFYIPPEEKNWNTKNIIYLGNFNHYPNVDAVKNFMNNCWEKVLQEVPDAKFHAIGLDPPQELLDLRSDNVVVRPGGDNENVRQIYQDSDVCIAPIELGTGFRGKLLEAMACGLPVVTTLRGAFGINPVNEENMFVTDDYDKFSEYVIKLLKDGEFRKQMSANALALGKKFDHIHAAERLEKVLKEE